MANPNPHLLLLLLLLSLSSPAISLSEAELDAAISALRSRGYSLFGNAVAASDLRLDLLLLLTNSSSSSASTAAAASASFTFFAPTDSALFALDMASPAASYLRSLRYHVALGRLPLPALLALPSPSLLPTLIPGRRLSISRRRDPGAGDEVLAADGVDVVAPGIFDGGVIAVHGLDGILSPLRREIPVPIPPQSPDPPSIPPDPSLPPSVPPGPRSPAPAPAPSDLGVLPPSTAPAIATWASAPISTPSTAPISPPERGFPPEGTPPSTSPTASPAPASWSGGVGAPVASEGSQWCDANAEGGRGAGGGCGGVAAHRGRPRLRWTAEIDDYGF